ncbi:MAG: acyltransferase family protein [Thermocrispum sp.]
MCSPDREPLIDLVRAAAMVGVVVGHWLVTVVVIGHGGALDRLTIESSLRALPDLTPLSWVLQTLGLFFFAGGYAATVSRRRAVGRGEGFASWWLTRVRKLATAVAVVLAGWAVVLGVLALLAELRRPAADVVINLVTSPLWFLAVYLALLALTPLAIVLHRRLGVAGVCLPAGLAVAVEVAVSVGGPAEVGYLTLLAVWWSAWQLGVSLAAGWRPGVLAGWVLVVGGVVVCVVLVLYAGYPASAVGGTAARSNLNPPSAFALALAAAQLGVVRLLAGPLRTLAVRRRWRTAIAWVNDRALPIFLLHQSALVTVVLLGASFGALPGLHQSPEGLAWPLARLAWCPVFAAVLVVLLIGLQRLLPRQSVPARH